MIQSRMLGNAKITNIVEYVGPTHAPRMIFPALDPLVLQREMAWLAPKYYVPTMDRLVIAIQLWVVEIAGAVIVVDTGVGNRKRRAAERMNMLNTLTLAWLEAAGASRDSVTHVVMTHLHSDHVGWNTIWEDDRWVPTFPRASYFAPKRDYDYFLSAYRTDPSGLAAAFDDSMFPVMEAGQLNFLSEGDRIADSLEVTSAIGHTPGMITMRIGTGDGVGVFSADVLHHPIQILQPSLNTAFCILPEEARATRSAFLADVADRGALFMPCHFPWPGCGYVRRQRDGYLFEGEE